MAAGVRVYNIPEKCTEGEVKIHFAKPENGGGPVEAVYYPLLQGDAVVIFEKPETTDEVLQHNHTMRGETLDVHPLPIPQVFTTMEAKFDSSVIALIQTIEEIRDELQYYRNIEFCKDDTGNITGMRGNWYLLEWVWTYIERMASRQNDIRRDQYPTSLRDHEHNESRSQSPMQLDDPVKSMPSATDINTKVKDKSTGAKKKITDSATAEVKMKAPKQTTHFTHDRNSGQIEYDSSVKAVSEKKESLGDDKNLERFTALVISEPDKNINDMTIIGGTDDDFRSLDFRYGPLTVSVYTGLITMAETDAIVNAANGSLAHYGGIASAIANAAGPEMQRQCEDYVSKSGLVPTTGVMHTCAGGEINLKVKYVMHAVGPMFSSAWPTKCALELTQTFLNCMKYGNDVLKIETVAMPIISSGIFGCPLEICVRSFFNAVLLFACEHMSDFVHLKEVHLVNNSSDQTALTVIQLRDLISLGTQRLVLEAQQQMQQKNVEDVDYPLSREVGQRLKMDRDPDTNKSKYGLARSAAERDYDSSLTTGSTSGLVDYSLRPSKGREYDYSSTYARVGASTASFGDHSSLVTGGVHGSGLVSRSPNSFSETYGLLQSSRNSAAGNYTSFDRGGDTNSPDTRDTSGSHFSGPPTISYLYSSNEVSSSKPGGSMLGTTQSTTSRVPPKTDGRPLPPIPKTASGTVKRY